MDLNERIALWNQYFGTQGAMVRSMADPWRSYSLNNLSGMLRALVAFLKGDREAIDKFESDALKVIAQIRESQRLLSEALGSEEKAHILTDSPFPREAPDEQEKMKGITYIQLTGIPDVKEARSFLESLIGSPVESCAGCGRLFLRSGKNRKLCGGCKGTGQDEDAPRRKAYRQVFMAFKRRIDKGLSSEKAKDALRKETKYADLIRKWNLDLSDWN